MNCALIAGIELEQAEVNASGVEALIAGVGHVFLVDLVTQDRRHDQTEMMVRRQLLPRTPNLEMRYWCYHQNLTLGEA